MSSLRARTCFGKRTNQSRFCNTRGMRTHPSVRSSSDFANDTVQRKEEREVRSVTGQQSRTRSRKRWRANPRAGGKRTRNCQYRSRLPLRSCGQSGREAVSSHVDPRSTSPPSLRLLKYGMVRVGVESGTDHSSMLSAVAQGWLPMRVFRLGRGTGRGSPAIARAVRGVRESGEGVGVGGG